MKNTKTYYETRKIKDLKDMLVSSEKLFGDKSAFLVKKDDNPDYKPVTYSKFKNDVDALGTAFISLGLKGKRIAIIGENRYEWAVSYLAAVNGTGIVVPIDKELPVNEIENLVKRSDVSAVIYSGKKKGEIDKLVSNIDSMDYFIGMDEENNNEKLLSFNKLLEKGYELVKNGEITFIDAKINPEEVNILLFTSATTSKSKAVMLCHKNITANLMAMASISYIGPEDTMLSVLPMHHTYECTCGFLCAVYRGCTVAFCEGLRHIPKNFYESKATMMLGVPLIFEGMHKKIWDKAEKSGMAGKLKFAVKLSNFLRLFNIDITRKLFKNIYESISPNLRLFVSGAAAIDPKVSKSLRSFGITVIQGYGLTECAPIVALNSDKNFKDAAAGLPLPGLDVKIHNPNDDGIGEIIVKGDSVMLGYYEEPEATARSFTDGYFRTGDLGYIDKDNFMYITGRAKNVIVTKNGKNIYPEEIETLLLRSPYIKECMVYGKEGDETGNLTVASSILPDIEKINEVYGEISRKEIEDIIEKEIKKVNKQLVTYKYIKDFNLRETEFAKTTTQKIKRYMEE